MQTPNKFITSKKDQIVLALWSADCAQRVLRIFEAERPNDDRPRLAIKAARDWAKGKISVGQARAAALAAHAAARKSKDVAACAAARAAGHAAATAHVGTHSCAAAAYARKAAANKAAEKEKEHQSKKLPKHLLPCCPTA